MKRLLLLSIFLITLVTSAFAQDKKYAFYIDFDQKVIFVDSLRLANSSSPQRILGILPELLNRPGTNLINNYDIKLNGLSLGDAADAALMQLQLADIEKIEVSETSASSYQNNGQGGSINIILRKSPYEYKGVPDERSKSNFWGSLNLGGMYQPALLPSLRLNWRNKNWHLHTVAVGCLGKATLDESTTSSTYVSNKSQTKRAGYQFVGAYMNYTMTPKDLFEFKISERYSRNRNEDCATLIESGKDEKLANNIDTARNFEVHGLVNYKHLFNGLTYEVELQSAYKSNHNGIDNEPYHNWINGHQTTLSGTMNVQANVFKGPVSNYGKVRLAVDMNYTHLHDDWNGWNAATGYGCLESNGHTMFVMPNIRWECRLNNFLMRAQAEYQYFKNDIGFVGSESVKRSHKDFTGLLVLEQQIGVPHHLRFMVSRKIQRPSYMQMNSFYVYMPNERKIVFGNQELSPTLVHEISLDYISRYQWGSGHYITIDAGVNYYRVDDVIRASQKIPEIPTTYPILYYDNIGTQNIVNGNLMVFYRHNSFSVSMAANVFNSGMKEEGKSNRHTYYNISLMPSFELADGWSCTLYGAYHSKVLYSEGKLGEVALTQLNIGRSFGRWHVNFYQKSAFNGKCEDEVTSVNGFSTRKYDAINSEVGMGVRFLF